LPSDSNPGRIKSKLTNGNLLFRVPVHLEQ